MATARPLAALLDDGLVRDGAGPADFPAGDPAMEVLPAPYREALATVNGFTVYHGMFRLFGVRSGHPLDVHAWNAAQTWRFAWDQRIEPFFLIGETAFGDQYAFRKNDEGGYDDERAGTWSIRHRSHWAVRKTSRTS